MKQVTEEFRDIKGYEGMYQVSNLGRVKSLQYGKEKILKNSIASHNYLTVGLSKYSKRKTYTIHTLVAEAFLGHTPNGYKGLVVNHIDFNKLNNNASNLSLITQRENTNKKHFKGTSKYTGVSLDKNSGKWYGQITINGGVKYLGLFIDELEAHNAYQIALSNV